jgi:acyl transferase domain-containing protein
MTCSDSSLKELLRRTALTLKHTQSQLKEAQEALASLQHRKAEPIAIIGMACRFPGGANSPAEYWHLMHQELSGISKVPAERWNVNAYAGEAAKNRDFYTGGFLHTAIDQFDAHFFGIAPAEANWMDPQHRLMLELAWEAIESAAIDPDAIIGSLMGIYIGICHSDYSDLVSQYKMLGPSLGTGISTSALAGRLSNFLGAQGPSISIDTACSSSLVAVHSACLSLQSHECNMALAGGIHLMLTPEVMGSYYRDANLLAKDGRCKTFDAKADGFVRGEGAGLVLLKRLSEALKDNDNILAVIRATGVNQNGAKSALTVPNGEAQKALIRQVLTRAQLSPHQINYVEAHAAGTSFGDAIEANAIGEALGECRQQDNSLFIGSVKTNIGYLEAAAGIAGLIKLVLALKNEEIPAHKNFESLNPLISFDAVPVKIPTHSVAWHRASNTRRLAGINAFGVCGTNAHAIVEEAPFVEIQPNKAERPLHIVTFSAHTSEALDEKIATHIQFLEEHQKVPLADIAYTANVGRRHFEVRAAYVAETTADLLCKMKAQELQRGNVDPSSLPKVTFSFADQGVEYGKMGCDLYETQPVFKAAFKECSEILKATLEQSLESYVFDSEQLDPHIATPALFAFEYALAKLWMSFGIIPNRMVGKGVGEYVSAAIAGVMSLTEALKLAAAREALQRQLSAGSDREKAILEFQAIVKNVSYSPPKIEMFSNENGQNIDREVTSAEFWLRQSMQFVSNDAKCHLSAGDGSLTLEISPSPILSKVEKIGSQMQRELYLPSICPEKGNWETLLSGLAQLYVKGVHINWKGFDSPYLRRKVILPTYSFQRQRYWVDAPLKQ